MKIDLPILRVIEEKKPENKIIEVNGLAGGGKAFFLLGLAEKLDCPIIAVTKNEEESENLADDLEALKLFFELPKKINFFPEKNHPAQVACLNDILEDRISILVISAQTLEEIIPKKEKFVELCREIKIEENISRGQFIDYLISAGYARAEFVEQSGEYSVRGEIVDLWPANFDMPLRIIFFENRIEEIRLFDPASQRSQENVDKTKIIPTFSLENASRLIEYISPDTLIFWDSEKKESTVPDDFLKFGQIRNVSLPTPGRLDFGARELPSFNAKFNLFLNELEIWQKEKYRIYLYAQNRQEEEKLSGLLEEKKRFNYIHRGEPSSRVKAEEFTETPGTNLPILIGPLVNGFILPEIKLAVISGNDIFARYKIHYRLPKFRGGEMLGHLNEIRSGDYIVHERYGIGIYRGLKHLLIEDKYADFLFLEYKGGDKLYVPITDFRLVQKYIGPEGQRPRMYSLDGISWERIKQKVKESIYNFARELLQVYAQRQILPAYSFPHDSYIEKEFAASFPYQETADQAKAIEDVKTDLISSKPMDRVVIGDVGYGKTEVAMRAGLKVVLAGKQVALLVPTTILAEQHYRTFRERFKDYPVTIEMLSRFRTKREQEKILADLKNGLVDIIIGTHRLLQKDIGFKELGLVVIDEEHRFGVKAKEKLKTLRFSVDILTLSATPIPRTLSMTLSGLREVSVIETPPEGRLPIETCISIYSEEIVKKAVLLELNRGGQVFYVYNRIETILPVISRLKKLFPEINIGLAHGQMSARELEKTMHKFLSGEYSLLVSTSIIESGLDLPRVNTLIVENAEEFGLAQLYQLRGRIGRGDQKAYCYLLCQTHTQLTENAVKRLEALNEFTSLGAGMRLALRDLEIRGAGNVIGPQQHGFISEIGYDLYCRLLEEEVKKLKGETVTEEKEPLFDFPLEAYFPEDYIPLSSIRIIFYKRILSVSSAGELEEMKSELLDRFGRLPEPVENLFSLAELRVLAKKLAIHEIKSKKTYPAGLEISFFPQAALNRDKIKNLSNNYPGKISFSQEKYFRLHLDNFPREKTIFFLKKYLPNLLENSKI